MNNTEHVLRGGSWNYDQHYAHADYRDDLHPNNRLDDGGFRVLAHNQNKSRVLRGGSWFDLLGGAYATSRYEVPPLSRADCLSFRVLQTPGSNIKKRR